MKLPRTYFSLFLLLVLFSTFFSFNIGGYLYANENISDVEEFHLYMDGVKYTIFEINATPIFLLEAGLPVTNKAEIKTVLHDYHAENSYPTQEEISEIFSLVADYNNSRFDNSSIGALKEEKLCLANIFVLSLYGGEVVPLFPCYDDASCEYTELMFCSAVGEKPFSMCRPGDLTEDFKLLSYASSSNDAVMGNITQRIDNYNEDNLYEVFKYIYDNLSTLQQNAEDIESSIFRTPESFSDECIIATEGSPIADPTGHASCFRLCGHLDLDINALNNLQTKLEVLLEKMEPFSTHQMDSESIYSETVARMEYKENIGILEDYISLYGDVFDQADYLLYTINDTVENKVLNQSLKNKMFELQIEIEEMNNTLYSFEFSGIDDKIEDYQEYLNQVEETLNGTLILYNDTINSKAEAELYVFILDMKHLDHVLQSEVDALEDQKEELDQNLSDVPTASELKQLNQSYAEVEQQLKQIMDRQSDNIIFMGIRSFSRNLGTNIHSLIINANGDLSYDQEKQYSEELPIEVAALNLFSLSCLGFFLYIVGVASAKNKSNKKQLIVSYSGLLFGFAVLVIISSVVLYFFVDKTTNSADLNEFILSACSQNTTAIVVNFSSAGSTAQPYMQACAEQLKEVIESKNKTVEMFVIGSGCTKDGVKLSGVSTPECIDQVEAPMFLFGYSNNETKVTVHTVFIDQIDVEENLAYYQECEIASIFKVIALEEEN